MVCPCLSLFINISQAHPRKDGHEVGYPIPHAEATPGCTAARLRGQAMTHNEEHGVTRHCVGGMVLYPESRNLVNLVFSMNLLYLDIFVVKFSWPE